MRYLKNISRMNKYELVSEANRHNGVNSVRYKKEIEESFRKTVMYDNDWDTSPTTKGNPNYYLLRMDTVSALSSVAKSLTFQSTSGNSKEPIILDGIALLNFASYKNPGGGYMSGSRAQEECLCYNSNLYSVLVRFEDSYYEWNRTRKNRGLYTDRALYTPGVVFANLNNPNRDIRVDVITCAAPNLGVAKSGFGSEEGIKRNMQALTKRVRFLQHILENNDVQTVILGAWGCGVFKQLPELVCKLFLENIRVPNVIFGIPAGINYNCFESTMKDRRISYQTTLTSPTFKEQNERPF